MIVYGLQFPTFNIINTTNLFAFHFRCHLLVDFFYVAAAAAAAALNHI